MKKDIYVSGSFASLTDIGKVRLTNEDNASGCVNAYGDVLLIVCDGMGGNQKGEYASKIAIEEIISYFMSKKKFITQVEIIRWIYKIIRKTNKVIFKESTKDEKYKGMGTTLTLCIIHKDKIAIAQIGDSRCYLVKENELLQMTEDQSYVQYLYRIGQIKKEEIATHPKRHVLMNALGIYPTSNVDVSIHNYNSESILLCSDGLYNNVLESDIFQILKGNNSTNQKAKELITLANNNGGSDNIAVVLWEANK